MNLAEIKKRSSEPYPENFWSYKVMRPLACHLTWVCLKLRITANQVTVINLLIGLSGCVLLAFGTHPTIILGALLLNINYLIDRVDGDIARLTNTTSKFGQLLDGLSDYLLEILIPASIGIGLYLHPAFGVPGIAYLLLGFTFSFLRALRLRVALYTSMVTGQSSYEIVRSRNIILKSGLAIIVLESILLLGFALGNILGIFLVGYTLVAFCELLVYTIMALRKVRK